MATGKYGVMGEFNSLGKAALQFYVEEENSANKYDTSNTFNISKKGAAVGVNPQDINAVLVFIKREKDTGYEFGNADLASNFIKNIDINSLPNKGDITGNYNQNIDHFLVIVFHDNVYTADYIKFFFDNLEKYYTETFKPGNNGYYFEPNVPEPNGAIPVKPRVAGFTIIKNKVIS